MSRYRVCVHSYVVVEASNETYAKANAELAVRKGVQMAYRSDDSLANLYAEPWARYGFVAKGKPEKLTDDD